MAETTKIRRTRIEERTTIEVDGDELAALIASHFALAGQVTVKVTDSSGSEIDLDQYATVRVVEVTVRENNEPLPTEIPGPDVLPRRRPRPGGG